MSDQRNGGIVWTEQTWNPLRGCSRVSAGCVNCYAEAMAARFCGPGQPYEGTINPETKRWNGKIRLVPEKLTEPIGWTRPRMVFVNSMSDLFHPEVPNDFLPEVFAVMAMAKQHTFQVLTKRPERMCEVLNDEIFFEAVEQTVKTMGGVLNDDDWPLQNVWIGVTVESQQTADERIPLLLNTPAAVRWVSMEPLLGHVDLSRHLWKCCGCHEPGIPGDGWMQPPDPPVCCNQPDPSGLDWVVVGGESGPNARPMHADWARSLRDQCKTAGVPFLFKQWGEWIDGDQADRHANDRLWAGRSHFEMRDAGLIATIPAKPLGPPYFGCNYTVRIGKKRAGRLLDGVLHDGYPEAA